MLRMTTALLLVAALPALASMPGEDEGPAPTPQPGTGAGAALSTGWTAPSGQPASADALPMTYEVFEATVPHVDLAACPPAMAAEARFCRLGVSPEGVVVFAFREDGDQPLVAARSWPADTLLPLLK